MTPLPDHPGEYSFHSGDPRDASEVAELVDAAYGHYVDRIGMLPGPMTEDYAEVIRDRRVTVAESEGEVVGVLVIAITDGGFGIDNVAVHPSHQGTGLGRRLLELAESEARQAGLDSVYLYTHEKLVQTRRLFVLLVAAG